jgi:Ca2+-binding RTX toxin-like protein
MATLRTYSATFEQTTLTSAAVARYRFDEGSGSDAIDGVNGIDGSYTGGAAPGAAGFIGDGAASFNGSTGFVLVETLSGTITVSAFGDSEIAGTYGPAGSLNAADRFSPNLQAALAARGLDADVIDRGIGGDTSGEGLARVATVVGDNADVVILEFGTNDALQIVNPDTTEANLRDIIDALQTGGVDQILLTGAFGFYPQRAMGSKGYNNHADRDDLEDNYGIIAGDTPGVVLLKDADGSQRFLGGQRIAAVDPADDSISGGVLDSGDQSLVFGSPPDGLHPNAAGVDRIVERVLPQTIALGAAAGVVNEPLLLASGAFEMWFTLDSLSQQQTLFSKDSAGRGTGGQVAAFVNPNGRLTFALSDESTTPFSAQSADGAVDAGTPTHLVANFGDGGMHIFLNGVEVGSGNPFTGGLNTGLGNFEQLVVGAGNGISTPGTIDNLNQFFDGTIDEFAIYDRALTGNEVTQLFQGGELGVTVVGSASADTIIGGADNEDLRGAGGNDLIQGNGGDDQLRGGSGNDQIEGGQGDDDLFGAAGNDELRGGGGNDELDGAGGNDTLIAGGGNDLLRGGAGADVLGGAGGVDQLFGNQGQDQLRGGAGNDLLNGGKGQDSLTGGAGSDTFQINKVNQGVDRIFGFEDGPSGDVIDLGAVLSFDTGDNVNDFVRLREVGANTKVEVDANGGGNDFTAVFNLVGVNGLDIGNLISDGNLDLGAPVG